MDTTAQPTIWEVPNDAWTIIEATLNEIHPAKPKGHRRVDLRRVTQWHYLALAHGLPMALAAEAIGRRQHRALALPALVSAWHLHTHLGCPGRSLRRVERGPLAVASPAVGNDPRGHRDRPSAADCREAATPAWIRAITIPHAIKP